MFFTIVYEKNIDSLILNSVFFSFSIKAISEFAEKLKGKNHYAAEEIKAKQEQVKFQLFFFQLLNSIIFLKSL